jgi:hypothetical protein
MANRKRQMAKVERTKGQIKWQIAKGKAAADIPFLSPKAKPLSFRAQRGISPWILVEQRARARFLAALGMTPYGNDPRESALGYDFWDLTFAICVLPSDLFFRHLAFCLLTGSSAIFVLSRGTACLSILPPDEPRRSRLSP